MVCIKKPKKLTTKAQERPARISQRFRIKF